MAKILCIDDDEGLCKLTQRAVRRRDGDIETATSGQAGLELLSSRTFDLVAVDHYMPGMDGLETLAAIKALPKAPPVVHVTGSEEGHVAVAALKAGAADYVVKSTDENFFDLLHSTFAQVLDRKRLAKEKAEAERQLRTSNERLAALLQEANHRVANSLQIVTAFVRLQASATGDEAVWAAFRDTQQRIDAIAKVHRRLYSSHDVGSVEMGGYLRPLLAELEITWSDTDRPLFVELEAETVCLPTDKAVSMGVLVSELVTNSFKYAYPTGTAGAIRVSLKGDEETFILRVEDDGKSFVPGVEPKGTGTGTKLVEAMAVSLGANIEHEANGFGYRTIVRSKPPAPATASRPSHRGADRASQT